MKTGSTVRLIQPVIAGVVKDRRINKATDELELLVEWDEGGEPVQRWFDADQLQAVEATEGEQQ
jgi:hypothetical protein